MPAIKYDIFNEQFDAFFLEKIKSMTPEQRERIPDDLLFKLFRNSNDRLYHLSHKEKEYILASAFNMRITIVLEDEVDGIGPKDYRGAAEAQKATITNKQLLDKPGIHASFVRANKELFSSLMYISHVHTSEINKLIRTMNPKYLTKEQKQVYESRDAIKSVINLLMGYEQKKKRLVMQFEMPMPEIYAMLYFASGERPGKAFYEKDFIYAYSCNKRSLGTALTSLSRKGMLSKRGGMKNVKYTLTAKGIDLLDKIVKQIMVYYQNVL